MLVAAGLVEPKCAVLRACVTGEIVVAAVRIAAGYKYPVQPCRQAEVVALRLKGIALIRCPIFQLGFGCIGNGQEAVILIHGGGFVLVAVDFRKIPIGGGRIGGRGDQVFDIEHHIVHRGLWIVGVAVDPIAKHTQVVLQLGVVLIRHGGKGGNAIVAVIAGIHAPFQVS